MYARNRHHGAAMGWDHARYGTGLGKMNPGRNYTRFLFWRVAESSLFRKDDFLYGMMGLSRSGGGSPAKEGSGLDKPTKILIFINIANKLRKISLLLTIFKGGAYGDSTICRSEIVQKSLGRF